MTSTLRPALLTLALLTCVAASAQWLKKSESSDDLYKEGKKELELKHYPHAVQLLDRAVQISPKNLDIHLMLGKAYGLDGKIDSARMELNYVIEKNPRYKDAYLFLVNIESVACNYVQALDYADQGLKYFPNDRDLLLKKLDIYTKEGDWIEGTKLADYLFERYSTDPYIRSVYLDYKLTLARQYSHRGYLEISRRAYEDVLEQDPLNKEALQAVFALDIRSGNYESSLAYVNRALQSSPNSYEFLLKKVSILEAMSRYVDAIAVLNKLMKLYPSNPEVQKLNVYMHMEAGRYYMQEDPYLQFQSVLEREPANREALNYCVSIATSRGMLSEALGWTNAGLKRYPNDHDLLMKKMGILEDMKRYDQASLIAEKIYKNNPSATNRSNFIELRTLAAKQFITDQDYDSAVIALKSVLFYDHKNMAALNYMINAYNQQKRYDEVLHTIDEALTYYPGNADLLFRKAGTLEAYQHYSEAAAISKDLLNKYPDNKKYLVAFVEQELEASKQSMQYDDYYSTITILQEVLDRQPDNPDALNYMINILSANKQYDSALVYADQALKYYPDNRDFQLKKSAVLADATRYEEAVAISGDLYNNYPYNIRYRNAYVDQLCAYGKQLLGDNKKDEALTEFNKALDVAPKDTLPMFYTINLLMSMDRYDDAMQIIERGRQAYPTNTFFLLKKAQVYENETKWDDAWHVADTLLRINPSDPSIIDYDEYLYSRRLRNELGFSYLHSKIVDTAKSVVNSIATVQYTRFIKNGSLTARLNYAGRFTGQGYQFEGEGYYTFSHRVVLNLLGAYSPDKQVFPIWRVSGSLGVLFGHGWQAEIGGRYLYADQVIGDNNTLTGGTLYSGMLGLSKEFKELYFGLRYYLTEFTPNVDAIGNNNGLLQANKTYTFNSGILTSRYYINNHKDFFTAILGYGTIPDDFSRLYNITNTISFPTVSGGLGYTKQIHYLTRLGIFATWYNEKIGDNKIPDPKGNLVNEGIFINQYDIYVTLLRKF